MMRKLLYLTAFLFVPAALNAQITITSSGYPGSLVGVDSLRQTLSGSAFPSFGAATAYNWDMSLSTYSSAISTDNRVPSTTGAQFGDSTAVSFGALSYLAKVQKSVTSNGYVRFGQLIQKKVVNLAALTSNPHDSIVVDSQYMVYSTPDTILKLPATYLTNWHTHFTYNFNFHLTDSPFFSNTPGYVRSIEYTNDTVIGWGQMRVMPLSGSIASGYMSVLQVKCLTYVTDSFYVGGFPAPAALLLGFGFSQGQTDTFWEQNYYRPAEITPLAFVSFNSGFATPQTATTHAQRLAPSGINIVANDDNLKIYPNPAVDRTFTIELVNVNGSFSYDMIDMNGRTVLKNEISGNKATVSVPAAYTTGIYFLRIFENGKQYCVRAIDMSK